MPKAPHTIAVCGALGMSVFYRLKGVKPNDYSFSIVSENKILKCLGRLGAKKATGLDGIPAHEITYNKGHEITYNKA